MKTAHLVRSALACTLLLVLSWSDVVPLQINRRPVATDTPPAEALQDQGPLILEGAQPDLTIVYTGEVVGYVEPCGCPINPAGGLARRAGYLRLFKNKYPGTGIVLADTGNFSGDPDSIGVYKTRNLVDGMGTMSYDVVNVGTRELTGGIARFRSMADSSNLNLVNANFVYRDNGQPLLPPSTVREVITASGAKVKIGFIGLNGYDSTLAKETPEGRVVVMRDPLEAAKEFVPGLAQDSDMVVLLGNLSPRDLEGILSTVSGIDLALVSYGTRVSMNGVLESMSGVPVYYSGDQGKRLGEVRIMMTDDGPVYYGNHVLLTKRYPPEPNLQALIDRTIAEVNNANKALAEQGMDQGRRALSRGMGTPSTPEDSADPLAAAQEHSVPFATAPACATCHSGIHEQWHETHHARAFATLIEANQEYNPECVGCHVTGFDQPEGFLNARQTPDLANVQCEACHGNGTAHVNDTARPYGKVPPRQCFTCHTKENSPDFVFFKYWNKIKH